MQRHARRALAAYSLAPARYTGTRLIVFGVLVAAAMIALFGVRRARRPLIPPPGDRSQPPSQGRP